MAYSCASGEPPVVMWLMSFHFILFADVTDLNPLVVHLLTVRVGSLVRLLTANFQPPHVLIRLCSQTYLSTVPLL